MSICWPGLYYYYIAYIGTVRHTSPNRDGTHPSLYNLYCVGGDVKHCTIQSNPSQPERDEVNRKPHNKNRILVILPVGTALSFRL